MSANDPKCEDPHVIEINPCQPENENVIYHVCIKGPNSPCQQMYDYCKTHYTALHGMFSRNVPMGCKGQVNLVVNRDFERNEGFT